MVRVAALMRGLHRRDVLLVSDPLLAWWLGENVHGRHIWPGHNMSRAAAGASDALPLRVVVTAVERLGTESAARVIEKQ